MYMMHLGLSTLDFGLHPLVSNLDYVIVSLSLVNWIITAFRRKKERAGMLPTRHSELNWRHLRTPIYDQRLKLLK